MEAIERAEIFCSDITHPAEKSEIEDANRLLTKLSKRIG
jgi:hypothetical protein